MLLLGDSLSVGRGKGLVVSAGHKSSLAACEEMSLCSHGSFFLGFAKATEPWHCLQHGEGAQSSAVLSTSQAVQG